MSYDFKSIMHYDRRAFTKDGKPTIEAIGNENMEFGNSKDELLSYKDVLEVKALYDCQSKCLCSTHRVDYAMRTETSTYVE